jgi:hypothetical protein
VYLPHPAIAPWVAAFIDEAAAFPNGRQDDQVDAMTQPPTRLRSTYTGLYTPGAKITVNPFENVKSFNDVTQTSPGWVGRRSSALAKGVPGGPPLFVL